MNPVDNNINTRTQRSQPDQGSRRSGGVDGAPSAGRAGAGAASSGAGSESVSFTRTAEDLLQLETRLRELPGVDQARVESIREAISNGSYQIDAQRIVDNLLKSERELR